MTWRFDALADYFDVESLGPQGVFEPWRWHRKEHAGSEMGSRREGLGAQSVEAMTASMASHQGAEGPEADQADLVGKFQQLPDRLVPGRRVQLGTTVIGQPGPGALTNRTSVVTRGHSSASANAT